MKLLIVVDIVAEVGTVEKVLTVVLHLLSDRRSRRWPLVEKERSTLLNKLRLVNMLWLLLLLISKWRVNWC